MKESDWCMNMVVLTVHCKTSAKITLAPLLSFMNKNLYIFIVQTESYWICQSSLFVFKLEYFMMQYCGSLKCKTWHRFVIMKCLNHFWNFKPINFHPTDQKHIFKHFLLRIPWFNKKKNQARVSWPWRPWPQLGHQKQLWNI